MICEEDFLEEEGVVVPRIVTLTKEVCPVCETGNRAHRQPFCDLCHRKLMTRHRSHQLMRTLWGADPF